MCLREMLRDFDVYIWVFKYDEVYMSSLLENKGGNVAFVVKSTIRILEKEAVEKKEV